MVLPQITRVAESYNLDPLIIAAVVLQESAGNPWVSRFEVGYFHRYVDAVPLRLYVPREITETTERMSRATSWGLMQIMGGTARQHGYKKLLTQLLDPLENIELGALILANFLRNTGSYTEALLRYNGGGRLQYASEVLTLSKGNRALQLLGKAA
jgi:soluble lytic murein transglycosylase-like protein